ncbi:hypothetical protein [Streptomyces sp. G7(2002)]|uniref:hypothetical protein n=1 Tax=Streptomyces sp. G7(2002) TaxID=2971798 RepID=UPI00237D961A|nr:hypothetical protein [Streptomyces sp. G7(2002)]WDT54189.1 hypothetical protein NUT86_09080 [Streptomyces sp. G7(2002)]
MDRPLAFASIGAMECCVQPEGAARLLLSGSASSAVMVPSKMVALAASASRNPTLVETLIQAEAA